MKARVVVALAACAVVALAVEAGAVPRRERVPRDAAGAARADGPAAAAPSAAAPLAADSAAKAPAPRPKPVQIRTLGEGSARLHVADHGDAVWSMHAEALATAELLRLWREAGGPAVDWKTPIDRPFTLSVHRVPAERLVERVLEGYGYTLHYDASGSLVRVRVYSEQPTQGYKTARLTESLAAWREAEAPPVADEEAAPGSGAAPAATLP